MRIGKYEVLNELARGGMGVLYKARDPFIDRIVALKTLLPEAALSDQFKRRMIIEARAAGNLRHPNIVTIYDLGLLEESALPFIAMEFLEGSDLARLIRKQTRFLFASKLRIVRTIAEALEFAHRHGVVHRDVKPSNIFVTSSGVVKVVDFGIARMSELTLTNTGQIVGTLHYMAPEQIQDQAVDGRADIFSLGVMLYELLAGVRPFEAEAVPALVYNVLQRPHPPIASLPPAMAPGLTAILDRALAKDPAARYPRMSDFVAELNQLMAEQSMPIAMADETLASEIMERVVGARACLDRRDISGSVVAIREALALDPTHREAVALSERIEEDRFRAEVKAGLARVHEMVAANELVNARHALRQILERDSSIAGARKLLEEIETRLKASGELDESASSAILRGAGTATLAAAAAAAATEGGTAAHLRGDPGTEVTTPPGALSSRPRPPSSPRSASSPFEDFTAAATAAPTQTIPHGQGRASSPVPPPTVTSGRRTHVLLIALAAALVSVGVLSARLWTLTRPSEPVPPAPSPTAPVDSLSTLAAPTPEVLASSALSTLSETQETMPSPDGAGTSLPEDAVGAPVETAEAAGLLNVASMFVTPVPAESGPLPSLPWSSPLPAASPEPDVIAGSDPAEVTSATPVEPPPSPLPTPEATPDATPEATPEATQHPIRTPKAAPSAKSLAATKSPAGARPTPTPAGSRTPSPALATLLAEAEAAVQRGEWAAARKSAEAAVRKGPFDETLRAWKLWADAAKQVEAGDVAFAAGDWKRALESYLSGLDGGREVLIGLELFEHAERRKFLVQAELSLLNENFAEARRQLAATRDKALIKDGERRVRIAELKKEAESLLGQNHTEMALRRLTEVLSLNPDDAETRERLRLIDEKEGPRLAADLTRLRAEADAALERGDFNAAGSAYEALGRRLPADRGVVAQMALASTLAQASAALARGECAKVRGLTASLSSPHAKKLLAECDRRERVRKSVVSAGMVPIPAGTFLAGDEHGQPEATPAHSQTIGRFLIDRREVTGLAWAQFCTATGRPGSAAAAGPTSSGSAVTGVAWADADAFCRWSGKRLPSEMEWEWAARHPSASIAVAGMLDGVAEWTAGWFEAYPGNTSGDPRFGQRLRVVRGRGTGRIPAAARTGVAPGITDPGVGFRCAIGEGELERLPE